MAPLYHYLIKKFSLYYASCNLTFTVVYKSQRILSTGTINLKINVISSNTIMISKVIPLTIILNSVLLIIFLSFSAYWAFIFIRRIHCFRKYKRGVARCISGDESGYLNKQVYYHYETEIWKNVLLLLINLSEVLCGIFFFASDIIQHYAVYHKLGNNTLELPLSDCVSFDKPGVNQINIIYTNIPYINGLNAIGRSAELFIGTFCVCLMNYLIIRIKKIKHPYGTLNSRKFLIITTLLSAAIILTGFIQYTSILSIILLDICSIIYFCVFVHTSKRFKRALLQRALERLIQHGSNREEMKQYKYCKFTLNITSYAYLLIIISTKLIQIPLLLVSALFYGDCYFPFNLFPSLSYVILSEEAIRTLLKVSQYIYLICRVVLGIAYLFILSTFVFITISIWINQLRKYIYGNKKIRYSTADTNLEEPFIIG